MARRKFSATFGVVLRKHREALGLSQEALAAEADLDRTYVSLIERGQRNASLDVAHRVARVLKVRLSKLIAEAEGDAD